MAASAPHCVQRLRTQSQGAIIAQDTAGVRANIKRSTPQLNGMVKRSDRSDQQEFYQLLSYKGDADLEAKLDQLERFYNFHRPRCVQRKHTLRSSSGKAIMI